MRIVIQRVREASVTIGGVLKSAVGAGMMILVGVEHDDTADDVEWLVKKTLGLRIFDDDAGVMNRSVLDVGGARETARPTSVRRVQKRRCRSIVIS